MRAQRHDVCSREASAGGNGPTDRLGTFVSPGTFGFVGEFAGP